MIVHGCRIHENGAGTMIVYVCIILGKSGGTTIVYVRRNLENSGGTSIVYGGQPIILSARDSRRVIHIAACVLSCIRGCKSTPTALSLINWNK